MSKHKANSLLNSEFGPFQIRSLSKGESVCDHCGHKIKNIFVVENSKSQYFNIGSKCVEKVDKTLAQVAEHKMKVFKATISREVKLLQYKEEGLRRAKAFTQLLTPQIITGIFLVQIIEPELVEGLSKMLLESDCDPTSDPTIFESHTIENQNGLLQAFEGLIKLETNTELIKIVGFLKQYSGLSNFFNSLKDQLEVKGYLSKNQIEAVQKAKIRDEEIKAIPVIILKDAYIRVSKFMAKILGAKAGLRSAHFMFKVIEIIRETDNAYYFKLQASGRPTAHCACCGLMLTNKTSIKAGVGPICAEAWSIKTSTELNDKLVTTPIFDTWVPKRSIKERVNFK